MLHLLWKPLNSSGHWYSSAARKEQPSYWSPIWGCWVITWGDNSRHTLPPSLAIFFSPPLNHQTAWKSFHRFISPRDSLYKAAANISCEGPSSKYFWFQRPFTSATATPLCRYGTKAAADRRSVKGFARLCCTKTLFTNPVSGSVWSEGSRLSTYALV